ncbi:glycoside hydrolase family 25 protein [Pontixanthobacter aestiaquae]|uniref:Lysozyme n=1 Tax=Pontixanthobacter aestiaquae TaxID=1509367 RepID=A0A844Z5A2_9SPHN|nr:glycoside hydrolase family 25 protein [Pontixanthobacter aestiaquae]MDN3646569.1 glycoside hydrolase family 25 protein [Pontixanthobacter aestiaquae]MXO82446.1 lysozyme [Pontixanthobacter aestiaquae]
MARRKSPARKWAWRIFGMLVLAALAVGAWFWWENQHWTPHEAAYPDQGVLIAQDNGLVNFRTLAALGANFAYLESSIGNDGQDSRFAGNFANAREAGLEVGAVHLFDPCVLADGQSANFVTMVPREDGLMPPVIALDRTAENCEKRVSDAAVESELMTLINQIENHTGKPAILKVTPQFEEAYAISARLERNLWANRTRFAPTYTTRPWLLWSANEQLRSEAADEPIEWVVVQP